MLNYLGSFPCPNVIEGGRREHAVAQWLRHYAINRKVAGSIPDEVIFLNLPNPSRSTRPWGLLTSNRNEYRKHKNNNVSGE
jgi:hypothetical protein